MDKSAKYVQVHSSILNRHLMIAKCNHNHEVINMNTLFQHSFNEQLISTAPKKLSLLFKPLTNHQHEETDNWNHIWSTVDNAGYWTGYLLTLQNNDNIQCIQATLSLQHELAQSHYVLAAHDATAWFVSQKEYTEQLEAINVVNEAAVKAEVELATMSQHDFQRMIQNLQNCIFKLKRNFSGEIYYVLSEGKIAEQLQMTTEHIRGKSVKDIWGREAYTRLNKYLQGAFLGHNHQFELKYNGFYFYVSLSPVEQEGAVLEVVGSMIDITERKKAEETIRYMAHHDTLTKLPNRTRFNQKLQKAIGYAQRTNEYIGILFIDLDRFKMINDTLGHSSGDLILQHVADRLKESVGEHGLVSRQGGDEFIIYLVHLDVEEITGMADRIIESMSFPFQLGHMEVYTTPSIGISMYPDDGDTIEQLVKNADTAMYSAKESGKNTYQFFTKQMYQSSLFKLKIESELRNAIEQRQFELYYQPKVNIENGKVLGMEALIRWQHPEMGLISPNDFIPIAEETGLIIPIGDWVLHTACRQMKSWKQAGYEQLTVAINVSLKQFMRSDFAEEVAKILKETDLPPQYLELEITESIAQDAHCAELALKKINRLGVSISIDDFGIGYSSLSSLSQFPINRLKIDKSFVLNLNANNQAIIKTIIDIANHLNISVIAEGVEAIEQVTFLQQQNCNEAQGYYYSKPLSIAEADLYLAEDSKKV